MQQSLSMMPALRQQYGWILSNLTRPCGPKKHDTDSITTATSAKEVMFNVIPEITSDIHCKIRWCCRTNLQIQKGTRRRSTYLGPNLQIRYSRKRRQLPLCWSPGNYFNNASGSVQHCCTCVQVIPTSGNKEETSSTRWHRNWVTNQQKQSQNGTVNGRIQ